MRRDAREYVVGALVLASCNGPSSGVTPSASAEPASSAIAEPAASSATEPPAASAPPPPPRKPAGPDAGPTLTVRPLSYAWLSNADGGSPKATDTVHKRFPTPPGGARDQTDADSFGEWLRGLPLAAEGTAPKTHDGTDALAADDKYLAAVVAMSPGSNDFQQSSDVPVRLHAEWRFATDATDISYPSASGLDLPLEKFLAGQRVITAGASPAWITKTKPSERTHVAFRNYLDTVFVWMNGYSVASHAKPVPPEDLRAGDFFIHAGKPAHALVVLDTATSASGKPLALFAHALNPAQNLVVIRPGLGNPWWLIDATRDVITPYTEPFPWTGLRRLPVPTRAADPTAAPAPAPSG